MSAKPTPEELTKKIKQLEDELRKAVETAEALRESEAKNRLLLEKMTDTVWTLDMNMKPTYVSPATVEVLGYAP
ncbi:MAG TPA: PAS domain-containing protein [Syntrophales bacterium]|nr:PAS domain-containing protein [Syntrophales bacterium]HOS77499.1 PAS domain-containing protein [Syntrophales bacterium]